MVTRPELNGKETGPAAICAIITASTSAVGYRSGVQLLATAELTLQLGRPSDSGSEAAAIQNGKVLGNAIKSLKEPNLVAVFIGIILGLALGAIPISRRAISVR